MEYDYNKIGGVLRSKRLELGKDIKDLADQTKIAEKYLEAIEEGRISDFTSPVFYGLFVRSLAKEIGLDPEKLLEEFAQPEEIIESEEQPRPVKLAATEKRTMGSNRKSAGLKGIFWIALFVIAAAIIIRLLWGPQDKSKQADMTSESTGIVIMPDSGSLAFMLLPNDSAMFELTAAESTTIKPGMIGKIFADSSTIVRPSGPAGSMSLRLQITTKERSWFFIMADGDTVLNTILEEGQTRTLEARNRFIMSIGNPYGVELRLNDTLLRQLSPDGQPVRGLRINQENRRSLYLLPGDTTR